MTTRERAGLGWWLTSASIGLDRGVESVVQRLLGTGPTAAAARRHPDRGDVPGWVMVTLMTAGLVIVLWGLARQQLATVFERAISSVTSGP